MTCRIRGRQELKLGGVEMNPGTETELSRLVVDHMFKPGRLPLMGTFRRVLEEKASRVCNATYTVLFGVAVAWR